MTDERTDTELPSDAGEEPSEKALQEHWGRTRSTQFVTIREVTARYVAQAVLENAKGPDVIDLACGDGRMVGAFTGRYERIVGVDGSAFQIEQARKAHPGVPFHHSLIEELELDDRFDSALLINVLEHVREPVEVLTRAASLLKDDGCVFTVVPNANAINRRIALLMGTLESLTELSPYDLKVTGHRRYYTMQTLRADVEAAGLRVQASGGVFLRMLSFAQMDWFLAEGPWEEGGFGWGRVGAEQAKDWREEFCRASYELGKQYPEDCNCVWIKATR